MTPEEILEAALEKTTPAERSAFLDAACGQDVQLRALVEGLLKAHEGAGSFLEQSLFESAPTRDEPSSAESFGGMIGPYKLLQQIGEGGMGTVWMAEQTQPVQRKVALKIIKLGMDSKQVIARFEAERQALALMDHPNIAKVLDAGTIEGRPYFVMELVKGQPITMYCDENRLTPRQRLELFLPVCQSIQHAHQKGIIHRDIKPSNVLVAPYDGKPVVKVIDFGVAKATGQRLTEKTLFTEFGAVVGTLEYMSPEQAELNNQDIDTRSDIYSLGVLLYELLTGTTPLNRARLKQAAFMEMLRMIREEEPPKPSTRLSGSKDALPSISAQRQTEPAKLTKLVRGELDWIVMKALEKDRNRRYETATGFAADVLRYLGDEPVQAGPPSARYRLRKFVRRNRNAVAAGGLVLFALVVGIIGTTWGLIRAERARRETEDQAAITKTVNEFVQHDLLGQADVGNQPAREFAPDPDIRVRTLLDRAADTIERRFADRPLTEAAIRFTVGNTYAALSEYKEAERHLQRCLELRVLHLGENHRDTLQSKAALGLLHFRQAKFDPAETLLQDALRRQVASLGSDHLDALSCKFWLGMLYLQQAKMSQAETFLKAALEGSGRTVGTDHPLSLQTMAELGFLYARQMNFDRAEALHSEALRAASAKLGPNHLETHRAKAILAWTHFQRGRADLAEPLLQEVLQARITLLRSDHPDTHKTRRDLGMLYAHQGKYAQAEGLLQEAYEGWRKKLGTGHFLTLKCAADLASVYLDQEKFDEAEPLLLQVVREGGRVMEGHPAMRKSEETLVSVYLQTGRPREAEVFLKDFLAKTNASAGAEAARTIKAKQDLAMFYHREGDSRRAEPMIRECLTILERNEPADSWKIANTRSLLGATLTGQKKYAEAEPLLLRGYEELKRHAATQPKSEAPEMHPKLVPDALARIVRLYDAWEKPDEADKWRRLQDANKKDGKKKKK